MSIGEARQGQAVALAVEGELTIYRAAELKDALLDAVRQHAAPAFDLTAVTEFDSAGLQLLLVARQEAASLGKALRVQGASAAVRNVFELLGVPFDGIVETTGEGTAA
ncbi:STAS domain-containing protein [Massilia dura]|uniref:STAS domain-containing protein n=1 Tax=Pseudoduganella dura TaxID=321982 RepID=A0A6I3XJP8_9BURK|nr:STAS domain-containing protein [Pseudoduganella dura]MUI14770.1 STAS domain-containing protein [Pseudoduganella dura]GGX98169.1 sulfate transporter [Pseudoduganella dura]